MNSNSTKYDAESCGEKTPQENVCAKLCVKLYPNRDSATFAKEGDSSIGTLHTTAKDLATTYWDAFGDVRKLASSTFRLSRIRFLLEKHGFPDAFGIARVLSDFAFQAAAVQDELAVLAKKSDGWVSRVCSLIKEYFDDCEKLGLIEIGEAFQNVSGYLEGAEITPVSADAVSEPYLSVLSKLSGFVSCKEEKPCVISSINDVDFAFPAGPEVSCSQAASRALGFASENLGSSVCIYTDKELRLLETLLPCACERGASIQSGLSVSLADTLVMRTLVSSYKLWVEYNDVSNKVCDRQEIISYAVDFALSPYAAISRFDAAKLPSQTWRTEQKISDASSLDALWRADRTLKCEQIVCDLLSVSDTFVSLFELYDLANSSDEAFSEAFSCIVERLKTTASNISRSNVAKTQLNLLLETKAVDAIESNLECSLSAGLSLAQALETISHLNVRCQLLWDHANKSSEIANSTIYISPLQSAVSAPKGLFDHVVISDISNDSFSAKEKDDCLIELKNVLGISPNVTEAEAALERFKRAVASSSKSVTLMMPLHDSDSKETFPSFCAEEFIRCAFNDNVSLSELSSQSYLNAPTELFEVSKPSRSDANNNKAHFLFSNSPTVLDASQLLEHRRAFVGEDLLCSGMGGVLFAAKKVKHLEKPFRGQLRFINLRGKLSQLDANKAAEPIIVLSPSAMEAYLACPYKWFVERIISVKDLDEVKGPLERGSFAHSVLEVFYSTYYKKTGNTRPKSLEEPLISEVFDEVFSDTLQKQYSLEPLSGRYICDGIVDDIDAKALHDAIYESIKQQILLPSGFEIAGSELNIDPYNNSSPCITYAGFALCGRMDRVDVNPLTNEFYILDYKGSISNHSAGEKTLEDGGLPEYIQAIVYAQTYQKMHSDYDCVGAFYTSYKAKEGAPLVLGSWSSKRSEFSSISTEASRVDGDFKHFLDEVETSCAVRLKAIEESDISMNNAANSACKYCMFSKQERCGL